MGPYIKINVCATQRLTGDDGNVIGHFDQDNVNTSLSHTAAYQYDAEGRLISVDSGMTASYVYNAEGQRVEKDTSSGYVEYLFDSDGNPIGENNRTSWVDSWVPFNGRHIAHFESRAA